MPIQGQVCIFDMYAYKNRFCNTPNCNLFFVKIIIIIDQKALTSKMNAGGGGGVFLTGMEYGGDDELDDDEAREVAKR
jgi:hypothetical protein